MHDKSLVIGCTFFAGAMGGAAGAWLGGLMEQMDRKWHVEHWLKRAILESRWGLATMIVASVAAAVPVATSVDPGHIAKTWWILLIFAGGCFGVACTRSLRVMHKARSRVAGAFCGSLVGFYIGLAATDLVVDMAMTIHPGILVVFSVHGVSIIGGLLGAVLSSPSVIASQVSRRRRVAFLVAVTVCGVAIAWRTSCLERETRIVKSITDAGGAVEYGWILNSRRTSTRRFDRLYRFLALKVAQTVELVDGTPQTGVTAVSLEGESKEWIVDNLSTIEELTLHAVHLQDAEFSEQLSQQAERMRQLTVCGDRFDDKLFTRQAWPRTLTHFMLRGTSITDAVTKRLSQLERLRLLDVRDTQLTNQSVSILNDALPECAIYSTLRLDAAVTGQFREATDSQSFFFVLEKPTRVALERRVNRNGLLWSLRGRKFVIERQPDPPAVIYLPADDYSLTVQHSFGKLVYDFSLNSLLRL